MEKSIRILNVYYKEAAIIANKYIIPIQAGRALNEKNPNMR